MSFPMVLADSLYRIPADRASISISLQLFGTVEASTLMARLTVNNDAVWLGVHTDDALRRMGGDHWRTRLPPCVGY